MTVGRRLTVVISSFDSPGNEHYNGGGGVVVERIASWLAPHYQVVVVTAGHRARSTVRGTVRYVHLPVNWAGPRAGQLLFHALLPVAARRLSYDLWIESFTPPFSTSFLPVFSRSPVVGFAQNLSGREMWGRYKIPFFLIEQLGLRYYDNVVVLNSADGQLVERVNPSATVRIIPNSVEVLPVDEAQIGKGSHILFLGRIDIWHKGLDLLIAAYDRARIAMPLLIAGDGTPRDERKLSSMLSNCDGVQWLGRVDGERKHDLLRHSAFVVMPSRHEPFGLSALEGMSYGKPVVHFDLPTVRWIQGDVRVPPFEIDTLAKEMAELSANEAVREKLGRKAYATAQMYSPQKTAERHVSLVRDLLMVNP